MKRSTIRQSGVDLSSRPFRPTCVLISHDIALARRADYVLVVVEGWIAAGGHPAVLPAPAMPTSFAENRRTALDVTG